MDGCEAHLHLFQMRPSLDLLLLGRDEILHPTCLWRNLTIYLLHNGSFNTQLIPGLKGTAVRIHDYTGKRFEMSCQ